MLCRTRYSFLSGTIDSHNKAQLKKSDTEAKKDCNCRNKANCPLTGNCREHNIVYQAAVTTRENDNNRTKKKNTESYVGLTENEFKKRFANHKQSFTDPRLRNATELSKYIWSLKEKNTEYDIAWRILGKAVLYICIYIERERERMQPVYIYTKTPQTVDCFCPNRLHQ